MRCVVGLGNPGKKHKYTRHNVGYRVLDEIAGRFHLVWAERGFSERALMTVPQGGDADLVLVRPLTYMNLSGLAVSEAMEDYEVQPAGVLVIHDDMDLPLGKLRFRRRGGSGGHRGVESIIGEIGTTDFPRLKIGIGRPPEGVDPVEYVLSRFSGEEEEILTGALRLAAGAVLDAATRGIEWAMSHYNGPEAAPESGGN